MTTTTTTEPIISIRGVNKHYGPLHVLQDINLDVAPGEVVVVLGPSGSGKSTLCRTINRLETIDSGEFLFQGRSLREVQEQGVAFAVRMAFQGKAELLEEREPSLGDVLVPGGNTYDDLVPSGGAAVGGGA